MSYFGIINFICAIATLALGIVFQDGLCLFASGANFAIAAADYLQWRAGV